MIVLADCKTGKKVEQYTGITVTVYSCCFQVPAALHRTLYGDYGRRKKVAAKLKTRLTALGNGFVTASQQRKVSNCVNQLRLGSGTVRRQEGHRSGTSSMAKTTPRTAHAYQVQRRRHDGLMPLRSAAYRDHNILGHWQLVYSTMPESVIVALLLPVKCRCLPSARPN